jgi:hypothetical protein
MTLLHSPHPRFFTAKKVNTKLIQSIMLALILVPVPAVAQQTKDSVTAVVTTGDIEPVKAGDSISFHIDLNSVPNVPQGYINVGLVGPGGLSFAASLGLVSGKSSYDMPVQIPLGAPGGKWRLVRITVASSDGMNSAEMKFVPIEFEVIQDAKFSLPTEATVTINPNQAQLLRRRARDVQAKLEELKASLAALVNLKRNVQAKTLLRQNVHDAEVALNDTEQKFVDFMTDAEQKKDATIFFDDLHRSYQSALIEVNAAEDSPGIVAAAFQIAPPPRYSAQAQVVFRAFEENELAYNLVADSQTLTFNLAVRTNPQGAKVSYGRRGDTDFQTLQDSTNSEIKALPYAMWIVRFEKPDYVPAEREHNPFTDTNHVLDIELTPEKKSNGK